VSYLAKRSVHFDENLNFFSTEERMTWTSWMTWG